MTSVEVLKYKKDYLNQVNYYPFIDTSEGRYVIEKLCVEYIV